MKLNKECQYHVGRLMTSGLDTTYIQTYKRGCLTCFDEFSECVLIVLITDIAIVLGNIHEFDNAESVFWSLSDRLD